VKIGVPKESYAGEKRVATTPDVVSQLLKLGFAVAVESGAGELAKFSDSAYSDAGAQIVDDTSVWSDSTIILKVRAPSDEEIAKLNEGQTLISFIWPAQNEILIQKLADKKVTVSAQNFSRTKTRCPELYG